MFINVLLILEKEIYNFNHKIGDTMATAQKIIKSNNRIDVIETTYNNSFKNVINRNGRPKRDFELMSDTAFKKCKYEKCIKNKLLYKIYSYIFTYAYIYY